MSRAFVKESDLEERLPPLLPPLPPGVDNHITPAGAERLRAELARLVETRRGLKGQGDADARSRLLAVEARIAQLEQRAPTWVVTPCPTTPDRCVFGARVRYLDGEEQARETQIVGVDEADPAAGRISFLSPLGRALMGAAPGDVVVLRTPRGSEELTILGVEGE